MFGRRSGRLATGVALATGAALALSACGAGGGGAAATLDPDEEVTLTFSFWGNDVRADLYDTAIGLFEEKNPNITVNASFVAWDDYWEKRQTEAAGGNLPDVMQFDYSYLSQFSESGLLYDLTPYLGDGIDTSGFDDDILDIGKVGEETTAITISTNAFAVFTNPTLLDSIGAPAYEGGDWDDYVTWMTEVSAAAAGAEVYGGSNFSEAINAFEIWLTAQGKGLFSDDGEALFTKDDVIAFWNLTAPGQVDDDVIVPQQRVEELSPLTPFDAAISTSEMTWDNFGLSYLTNLGDDYSEVVINQPPVYEEGAADMYLKPSMLYAAGSNTEHPAAAAAFIDFLLNDEEAGEVFGTNRGLPASSYQRDAVAGDPLTDQIIAYEDQLRESGRLGDTPPPDAPGQSSVEDKFKQFAQEIRFGTKTVDEAADELFAEIDAVMGQ